MDQKTWAAFRNRFGQKEHDPQTKIFRGSNSEKTSQKPLKQMNKIRNHWKNTKEPEKTCHEKTIAFHRAGLFSSKKPSPSLSIHA